MKPLMHTRPSKPGQKLNVVSKSNACTLTEGGEFLSGNFTTFLHEQGTKQHLMMHDTPQHNAVAKTLNHRLLEHVHTLITQAGLPKMLWSKALHFTVRVKNHTLTCVLGTTTTPYKQFTGCKPSIAGIPKWGQCI
jgi:hypothetical protein